MTRIETRATSNKTAEANPILLRETETSRLLFLPVIVDNTAKAEASVDGTFVWERKTRAGTWQPVIPEKLASLKSGEGYKLVLHAEELLTLVNGLKSLYELHGEQGVPRGKKTFVAVQGELEQFLKLEDADLRAFLNSHKSEATNALLRFVRWLMEASPAEAASRLAFVEPEQLNQLNAVSGLALLKDAVSFYKANASNTSEEFWQTSLNERLFVISNVFAYPVVITHAKAYVGRKSFENKGGRVADFMGKVQTTEAVVLIEIKTPQTPLLGSRYRNGVYPLSQDLMGSVAQIVNYRQSLLLDFNALRQGTALIAGEPKCLVIAGNCQQFANDSMRENFELMRERMEGVSIITFDELFKRIENVVALVEGEPPSRPPV